MPTTRRFPVKGGKSQTSCWLAYWRRQELLGTARLVSVPPTTPTTPFERMFFVWLGAYITVISAAAGVFGASIAWPTAWHGSAVTVVLTSLVTGGVCAGINVVCYLRRHHRSWLIFRYPRIVDRYLLGQFVGLMAVALASLVVGAIIDWPGYVALAVAFVTIWSLVSMPLVLLWMHVIWKHSRLPA